MRDCKSKPSRYLNELMVHLLLCPFECFVDNNVFHFQLSIPILDNLDTLEQNHKTVSRTKTSRIRGTNPIVSKPRRKSFS